MKKPVCLLIIGLVLIFSFSCESEPTKGTTQAEEAIHRSELLILPEGEATELYSIAFDSSFGSPDSFFGDSVSALLGTWTFFVGLEKNKSRLSEYKERVLNGKYFSPTPDFQEDVFREIIRNPVFKIPDTTNTLMIVSNSNYRIVPQDGISVGNLTNGNQQDVSVKFFPVGFNKEGDHAVLIISYLVDPEYGAGMAYFFQKKGSMWKVVAKNTIWLN